ncbi:MAG: diguanylate cyclase [Bacillota bacterium]
MFNIYTFVPLTTFICYFVLVVLILRGPKSLQVKAFAWYIGAMMVWSLGSFMMRTGLPPDTLFWNKVLLFGMTFVPIAFFRFSQAFAKIEGQSVLLYLGFVSYAILAVSNLLGLIVTNASLENGNFYYELGPMTIFMTIVSFGFILLSIYNLLPRNDWSEHKDRLKYPLTGAIIVLLGGTINLYPPLGQYPLDIAANTINGLLITFAIYRYRFLNITFIMRQGIVYSIITTCITITYLLLIFILHKWFHNNASIVVSLIMAVLIALLFQRLKDFVQLLIDRAFFRKKYDYRETLKKFSHIMTAILDLNQLSQSILELLTKAFHIRHASLFLRDPEKEDYLILHNSYGITYTPDFISKFERNNPLINWPKDKGRLLTRNDLETLPVFLGMWDEELKELEEEKIELFVPLMRREKLIGVIVLAEKLSDEPYSNEDCELLSMVANEAAIAIENAWLYQQAKLEANTDNLTKLYNHRYFHEYMAMECERTATEDDVFSLVLVDIDLFRVYNDVHGYTEGDKALEWVASVIRRSVRPTDITVRYGGDEFAIICPGIPTAGAATLAEHIRNSIENKFEDPRGMTGMLTVSAGVVCNPQHGTSREKLLKEAHKALALAKNKGGNKVLILPDDKTPDQKFGAGQQPELERNLRESYLATIYALAATIDAKDKYTYGHSANVTRYATTIAESMGLTGEMLEIIRQAAFLHDIGKIGVPEQVLNKKDPLNEHEWGILMAHVDVGVAILKNVPSLSEAIPDIHSHHERYDGGGYPRGLKGDKIPLGGRILSVADAFDAMTSNRPYRKAMSVAMALTELKRHAGAQFDPDVVDVFVKLIQKGQIKVHSPTSQIDKIVPTVFFKEPAN